MKQLTFLMILGIAVGATGATRWKDAAAPGATSTITSLTADGGPNIDRIEFVRADSGTTVLQRIPVRSNAFRNGNRNFLVNGRSAGALKNHASKIKIYSK